MPWDLVLSEHGDLIFAGNKDLAGVSGINLVEQRMKIRLRVIRGSWVYDTDGVFGSNLHRLIGASPQQAAASLAPMVNDALRGMPDVAVGAVGSVYVDAAGEITDDPGLARGLIILVQYRVTTPNNDVPDEEGMLSLSLPAVAGGGA